MTKKFAITLVSLTSLALAIAIVDTKPFDQPGFEKIQHAKKCPKGTEWRESSKACLPKY